jgi:hypothetical protein
MKSVASPKQRINDEQDRPARIARTGAYFRFPTRLYTKHRCVNLFQQPSVPDTTFLDAGSRQKVRGRNRVFF